MADAGAIPSTVGLGDQPRQRHEHAELREAGVGEPLARREPQAVPSRPDMPQRERHEPQARDQRGAELQVAERRRDRGFRRPAHAAPETRFVAIRMHRCSVAAQPATVACRRHVRRARACVRSITASHRW